MDTQQMVEKLKKCKVARLALLKMKQEQRAKKIQIEHIPLGYFVEFDELLIEMYNILNTANQKGFKI